MEINVNSINFNKKNIGQNKNCPSFAEKRSQIDEIPSSTTSFAVKTPMMYMKYGVGKLPQETNAHFYKLANGQKVIIIPKEGSTVVKTYVNSGSMNEPDSLRGISHFIEHNLFNGSEGLAEGEFFKLTDKMGAETNASTGFSETNYYIKSHLLNKDDLETKIRMHASMIETPKFSLNMLEKEKGPVSSEINMITDNPLNLAMNETIKTLFNIKTSSKDVIGGTVDNIRNLTRDDIVDYYEKNYSPANRVTVISGEVEPDDTMKLVAKYFSTPNYPVKPRHYETLDKLEATTRKDLISDKAVGTSVVVGFIGPENSNTKDKVVVEALTTLLCGSENSRLNKALDKIHLRADMDTERVGTRPSDNRAIFIATETSEENSEKALKTVFSQIANLSKNPPAEEELNIIKKKLMLSDSLVYDNSESVNAVVGTSMLDNDFDFAANFNNYVNNLTPSDIVEASQKYLNLNKSSIILVHPKSATDKSIAVNHAKAISFRGNDSQVEKKPIKTENLYEFIGVNNLHIITNSVPSNKTVFALNLSTNAPANVKPGTAVLLDAMLNRGSEIHNHEEYANELEKNGVELSFSASESGININGISLTSDSKQALKFAKEVIKNPPLNAENFEYAKRLVYENLVNLQPSPVDNMNNELFKNLPQGNTPKEILTGLSEVTLDDVKGLFAYLIGNSKGKFVVSGNSQANHELLHDLVDLPKFQPDVPSVFNSFSPVTERKVVFQKFNKNQADVIKSYKFKTSKNLKDSVTLQLLNIVLGGNPSSRLFQDLREKEKLAYKVNSRLSSADNSGVLSLKIMTTTENSETGEMSYDNLQKSLEGFDRHTQNLMDEKISKDELNNAKLALKNGLLSKNEDITGKNASILDGLSSFYGVDLDNKALKMIDNVTVDDIQNAARYIFSTKPVTSIVASNNTYKYNEEFLKTLGDVQLVK